jgi:hypothetical protein
VLIDAARNANSSGIAFLTQDRSLFKRFLTNPNPSATLNHAQGFVFMCPLVPDAVASWLLPRRCPFQSYMTTPSIYIRIDQLPVGSNSRFEAQLVIGDDETGQVAGFKSPVFESEDALKRSKLRARAELLSAWTATEVAQNAIGQREDGQGFRRAIEGALKLCQISSEQIKIV